MVYGTSMLIRNLKKSTYTKWMKSAPTNYQTSYKLLIRITSGTSKLAMFGESNLWINSRLKLLSAKTEKNVIPSTFQEVGLTFMINLLRSNQIMDSDFCLISNIQLSHKSLRTQLKMVLKNLFLLRLVITLNLILNVIKLWSDLFKTCQARLDILVQCHNTK